MLKYQRKSYQAKFVFKQDGVFESEVLNVEKTAEGFLVKSIPFFVMHIALNDLVHLEMENGKWFFERKIKSSGHSTVQVLILDEDLELEIIKQMKEIDCQLATNEIKGYYAIDIPKNVNYLTVIALLEKFKNLDYREASMNHAVTLK